MRPSLEALETRLAPANYSGTLLSNTTWDSSDVRVITGNLTIASGVTLTVNPGTVVKFAPSTSLDVQGTLNATGATFTSNQANPAPGDWGPITIDSPNGSATLGQVTISYGGSGGSEEPRGGDVVLEA